VIWCSLFYHFAALRENLLRDTLPTLPRCLAGFGGYFFSIPPFLSEKEKEQKSRRVGCRSVLKVRRQNPSDILRAR
jgi:hypothetical protein